MMAAGKLHADEIDTDVSLVGRLLATQFPQWAHLPIKPVQSTGTDNAIYRLGSRMAVRLPRTPGPSRHVEKEQQWLPKLAPLLPLTIPVPLAMGTPGEGYPWHWSINPWLEGENPQLEHIADPAQMARDLAQFISALQQIDTTGGPMAGAHNFSRGVPLAMRDAGTRAAIGELSGLIDTDAVTTAWDVALQTPAWPNAPVWIHGDLQSGNLLIQESQLSAVIDFGGLAVGDPACDLLPAWNFFDAANREIFRAALSVDDATWARGRGWALSIALIALPYYLHTSPVIAADARRTIAEVLADHQHTA
jgi:aminoglycoside phosphotransferase (APT) family kinase protein